MPYYPAPGSGGGSGGPAVDQTARDAAYTAQGVANNAKSVADAAKTSSEAAVSASAAAQATAVEKFSMPAGGLDESFLADSVTTLLSRAASSAQPADLVTYAPTARTISTGSGLTGGGSLTANRTLSLTAAALASLLKADTAVQPAGLTKTAVGLSNVDNTSDVDKPISTAQQSALDGKAALSHTHSASQITDGASTWAPIGRGFTAGTGLSGGGTLAADRSFSLNAASIASLAKADSAVQPAALTSAIAGKADASAVTTALTAKADLVNGVIPTSQLPALAITDVFPVTSQAQMLALAAQRGDVAIRADANATYILSTDDPTTLANWLVLPQPAGGGAGAITSVNGQTGIVVLGKADVGLGNVDNTSDANKPVSTAQQAALDAKAAISHTHIASNISDSGTLGRTLLQAATAAAAKTALGLDLVSNTADADKPISTATATALALLAPKASPTFTGTVSGVTAAMVGLANVDNTSDANKPVSTAQQTALNLKSNIASPTFTGTPAAPTAAAGTNTTQVATTAYVQANASQGDTAPASALSPGATSTALSTSVPRTVRITLTANATFTIASGTANTSYTQTLVLVQDATGSRTITWPTGVKWVGGVKPTLTTTANGIDLVHLFWTGTEWIGIVGGLAFA